MAGVGRCYSWSWFILSRHESPFEVACKLPWGHPGRHTGEKYDRTWFWR